MTLADLSLPMPLEHCRDLALVYSHDAAVALYELQQEHGDWRNVCYGRRLTDDRWMIDGEILSAVGNGGTYGWVSSHMDSALMSQIEIVPMADAVALLLPDPVM
ncbi:MAG: hypothetical protein EBR82_70500 [Caulobacteraceae bacterium]|nr:hypothetical protein [Caulobacteraceae bacterium]